DDLMIEDPEIDAVGYNPVLMVKDFDSTGFTVAEDFMTNADTPFLALDGLIADPVNPFTGKPIKEGEKTQEQIIYVSDNLNTTFNNGNQFEDPDGYWLAVTPGDIRDDKNWRLYE
ncbi:MAG: hypothetical protein J5607_03525, partial [Clostridiales bacterium]|nr:hypothetical protein [Clostridiales bacterium]